MSKMEIVSVMNSLSVIFLDSKDCFVIPDFQRNFVWGAKEAEEMMKDFMEDTDDFNTDSSQLEGYLLGNIVLIAKDADYNKIVIDGQQRLTTLSLLFKALEAIGTKRMKDASDSETKKWMKRISNLDKGYQITDDDDSFVSLRIQHSPSLNFGEYYKKLIHDDLDGYEPEGSSDENIKNVYDYFYNFVDKLTDDQLTKFIIYLKTKVKLIVTSAPTESKAFQLFEVLNDRGRSLEPMDLIKNTFLKTLNTEGKTKVQIDDFNTNWKNFIDYLVVNKNKQISSSAFLRHYLMAFNSVNVKQNDLFSYFNGESKVKSKKLNGNEIIALTKALAKYAKYYAAIEREDFDSYLQNDNNMYVLFKILALKQMQPLLMLFYFDADMSKKRRLLDSLTRLGAAVMFSYTQTNYIEKLTPQWTSTYHSIKDKEAAFDRLMNDIETEISNLATVAKAIIPIKNFSSQSGGVQQKAFDLLKFVELYFNKNPQIIAQQPGKRITVEHIYSKSLVNSKFSEAGFVDSSEAKDYVNRIGNLTLLYNTDNSSLGNATFSEKIPTYKDCDFRMTSVIVEPLSTTVKAGQDTVLYANINKLENTYSPADNGYWTKELIEKRSESFADAVYCILTNKY